MTVKIMNFKNKRLINRLILLQMDNTAPMNSNFHFFLHKQILLMLALSLIPGLAYIFPGWLNGVIMSILIWHG